MQANTITMYRRFSNAEREELSRGLARGESLRDTAGRLGRHVSTLAREVTRNQGKTGYRAFSAGKRAEEAAKGRRTGSRKLSSCTTLRRYVLEKLVRRWSPEQIAKRIKTRYPHDTTMRISHEAIYRYIYSAPSGRAQTYPHQGAASGARPSQEKGRAQGKRRGDEG